MHSLETIEKINRQRPLKWHITDGGPGTVNVWAWPLGRKRRIRTLIRSNFGRWQSYNDAGHSLYFPTLRQAVRFALSTIKEVSR